MESIALWLKDSILARSMAYKWSWPACETLHFIGMALLIGAVVLVDLRMLGFFKRLSFEPLHRLLRWGIAGFLVNAVTGLLFFAAEPFQYIENTAFYLKMLFILLAGINVLVFYLGPFPEVRRMRPGDNSPPMAKMIAATSIFLWFGVMFWGRMLPFIGNAF